VTGRGRLTLASAGATVAAALSFSAVFDGWSWLVPVVAAIAIVFAVNETVRRLRVPSPLGPLAAAGLVLCYLTLLDARPVAVAGVLPGPAALRMLGDTARSGFTDIRKLSTPVPTHSGLVFLIIVAMAAVALVVDLLAVTMRRAALAGIPLLAVFAVCTSVAKHGVGWAAFGVGTAGYLWLLLADSRDRISRWGRTLGMEKGTRVTWADQDLAPSPLSALGRRIGASAIVVGVVVPMLLPGLHGGVPKHGGDGSGNGGGHSVETLNPLVTLRAQLVTRTATPLLRYTTSDPQPGYLRLTALDDFNGTSFSPKELRSPPATPVKKGLNAPPVTGPTATVSVHVGKLGVHWLPLPTQAQRVHVDGEWDYDPVTNTVFSARTDTQDTSYSATIVRPDPSPEGLNAVGTVNTADFSEDVALPEIPGDIVDLDAQITAKAKTPFEKALAIQSYLTGGLYLYDTSVSGSDSTDALEAFLLQSKRGFCQQFAAAMAVLARLQNIPARVAVGFTRGDKQRDGSWLVTSHDAHAWPELYFAGYGWLPFEPTPRSDGQAVAPAFTQTTSTNGPQPPGTQEPQPTPTSSSGKSAADRKGLDTLGGDGKPLSAAHARHGSVTSMWWVLLALVALLLPVPALARALSRTRRWRTADSSGALAHAAWAELRAGAIDAGAAWYDGLSPRGAARVLRADVPLPPPAEDALDRLVRAEERARYAADPRSATNRGLPGDVEVVRAALLARCTPWARWRARVLPASTLAAARAAAGRIADGLDAFDRAAAWSRRRLLRLAPSR
jgi:transglutaminase-like putative cysteine protease